MEQTTADLELLPDIILPSQLGDPRHHEASRPPEHRLMLAVLEDAIRCYQRSLNHRGHRNRVLFRETEAWFMSDDTSSPFAFVTICETFDLEPEYMRAGLGRWRASQSPVRDGMPRTQPLRIRSVTRFRQLAAATG